MTAPRSRPGWRWVLLATILTVSSVLALPIKSVSANGCPLLNPQTGLYEADSEADLATIRTVAICLSRSIVQTADIRIDGPWTAIGTAAGIGNGPFIGTYDGQGHSITFNTGNAVKGIFLRTSGATIKNLQIDAIGGSSLDTSSGWLIKGSSPNTTVDNVSSSGDISLESGGIIGGGDLTGTTIRNSSSSGSIDAQGGGIVGAVASKVTVIGSHSSGSIGAMGAGGIVGSEASRVTVIGSYSTGTIYNSSGGIVGAFAGLSTVTNSFSTGVVVNSAGGGILGSNAGPSTVTDSFATGAGCGGGLIGVASSSVTVERSYSMGSTGCAGQGGLFGGYATNPIVTDSFAYGNIDQGGGGILGRTTSGQSGVVSNSYSTGNQLFNLAGGIYGQMPVDNLFSNGTESVIITNTYSTGTIGFSGGGIGGFEARGTISNSYSTGSIGGGTAGESKRRRRQPRS